VCLLTPGRVLHHYSSHGLTIDSEIELPGLPSSSASADLTVRRTEVRPWPEALGESDSAFTLRPDEARYFKPDAGAFSVRRGEEILVDAVAGGDERIVRLSLLGPALALALYQRRRFILHASAVEIAGRAVAFCGANGCGKSSIVTALCDRGHGFMADDLCSIDSSMAPPLLFPGNPQIKLWPDAARALSQGGGRPERLHPKFDKLGVEPRGGVSGEALPLARIYAMSDGDAVGIRSLTTEEALREILRHWYGTRFGPRLLEAAGPRHFLDCVRLADRTELRALERPRSFEEIDEVVRRLEHDMEQSNERVSR